MFTRRLELCVFFFKQKTAYEMRISDWSSDVCSSDLSACVGGKKVGDLCQHGQGCGRRSGFTDKRISVFAQEEDRRDFAGLIGRLPVPCTCRVGGAECRLHGGSQNRPINPLAVIEVGQ